MTGKTEEAAEWLAQAEGLYAGDVLEGDPYGDWAVSIREEARATYISTARALAEDASTAGHEELALRYLLRVLGHDHYDEHAHLALVSTLERSGRRGEARRAYRNMSPAWRSSEQSPPRFKVRETEVLPARLERWKRSSSGSGRPRRSSGTVSKGDFRGSVEHAGSSDSIQFRTAEDLVRS